MIELDSLGYISEIFSSLQGEGGTVRGSCFGKRQIFVRFSGCNLIQGDDESTGCFWCDSPRAQRLEAGAFTYETMPGTQHLASAESPIRISKIVDIIENLSTPDLHSISFTGGEPLFQFEVVDKLSRTLREKEWSTPLYLETNGTIRLTDAQLSTIAESFTYCCCDIKDRSAKVTSKEDDWKKLVKSELKFIKQMANRGVEVFAKLVVTADSKIEDILWIAEQLSKIRLGDGQVVGLAIQPAVLTEKYAKKYSISSRQLHQIFESVVRFVPIESLSLSVQAHKMIGLF
ncbi:MAG: 7-carboxy-7-deazaguanine synthase QueE [Candidatus Lokiarchaeota archaeon]|nr:7-carboxy-7-deazaguanine synthase QueE [Candidatus Lokiarchaeota archaeon]